MSASSTINGDETLAGKPQLKAEQRVAERCRQRRRAALARAGPPRSRRQAAPARLEAPEGRRPRRRPAAPARSRSRRSPDGYVPGVRVDRARQLRRRADSPTACSSTPAAARCSRARAWSTTRPTASRRRRRSTSAARCRRRTAPATSAKGPYTVTADAGVRAIDVFASADNPQRHRAEPLPRHHAGRPGRTPARRRSASATNRPAASRPATTSSRSATSRAHGARGPRRAPTPARCSLDDSPPPTPYLARWNLFPANPPLSALDADPWNTPSTDTRQKWCWRSEPDRGRLRSRDRQPRLAHAVGRRRQDRHADEHDDRQQRAHGRVLADRRTARAEPVPPDERDARLHVPVDERVVHDATATPPTRSSGRASTSRPR